MSLETKRPRPPYTSIEVQFTVDGRLITTTTFADGEVTSKSEQYRMSGDSLLVSTEQFLVNASYSITDDELTVTTINFRAVLQRLPP